jgi:predicted nucleic acid-binding protein
LIYLDSSVALAHILSENLQPPDALWREPLFSSRLLLYEVWSRLHAYGMGQSHAEEAEAMCAGITLVDMTPDILRRALDPFPAAVRTLDGMHLATANHLKDGGIAVRLASYDKRMNAVSPALGIDLFPL